jgi:hypothetical protein
MMTPALMPPVVVETLPSQLESAAVQANRLATVKRLIWLYFWLLIFEGALRKWILPGWSNPLLLIRDPVVILIYIFAAIAQVFPRNAFIYWIAGLGFVSLLFSEIGGRGNLLVSLFGFRTSFLHLPLIFLIPNVFTKEDMDRMARWLLITSIPMCLLVLAQFRASPDAWLNNGAGGGTNGQLESAYGRIRPPGTFSFTAGLVCYLSMVAAFAMHCQMHKKAANLKLAAVALPAVAIMVGVSGSRSVLGSVILILLAIAFVCLKKPAFFGRGIKTVVVLGAGYFLLSSWSEFQQGLEVHQSRIEGGGGLHDGIVIRTLSELTEPFRAMIEAPFFGVGLGMGTNAASGFLYGQVSFNLGEGDWGRVVRESGPILGFAYIGLRIGIIIHLARRALESLKRDHPLPMLLLASTFPEMLNGQFGVPSLLGLAVFSAALCLASNNAAVTPATALVPPSITQWPAPATRGMRGRSVYAEQLHGEIEDPEVARFGP